MLAVARGHGFNFSRLFSGICCWCNGSNVEGPIVRPVSRSIPCVVTGVPWARGTCRTHGLAAPAWCALREPSSSWWRLLREMPCVAIRAHWCLPHRARRPGRRLPTAASARRWALDFAFAVPGVEKETMHSERGKRRSALRSSHYK